MSYKESCRNRPLAPVPGGGLPGARPPLPAASLWGCAPCLFTRRLLCLANVSKAPVSVCPAHPRMPSSPAPCASESSATIPRWEEPVHAHFLLAFQAPAGWSVCAALFPSYSYLTGQQCCQQLERGWLSSLRQGLSQPYSLGNL